MPGPRHDLIVSYLKAGGAETRRFRKQLHEAVAAGEPDDEEIHFERLRCQVVPDAFKIFGQAKLVRCFEVECEHSLAQETLDRYADLAFELDYWRWRLDVVAIGPHFEHFSIPGNRLWLAQYYKETGGVPLLLAMGGMFEAYADEV